MKTLKTKRLNIAICWNGLRGTPPKEFPSVAEMEKTADILEGLKGAIPEFTKLLEEGETLNTDINTGKIPPEQIADKKADLQKRSNILEEKRGEKEVSVELENDIFTTLFNQIDRWGKNWFLKLEPYLEFRKNLKAANQQPKEKEKKGK